MNVAISLVRICAILLIVNEHLELVYYPRTGLAVGGYLGNSLFYFVSGWGLTQSFVNKPIWIVSWYKRRFLKLFAMLALFISFIYFPDTDKIISTLKFHLIPTPSKSIYFIPNIIVLYALSYWLVQLHIPQARGFLAALVFMPIVIYAILPQGQRLITYTFPVNAVFCFLLGVLAAQKDRLYENRLVRSGLASFALLMTVIILHVVSRRFAFTEITSFYVTIFEIVLFYSVVRTICGHFDLRAVGPFLYQVASSSLAVYLVHFSLIDYFWSQKMCGSIHAVKLLLIAFALGIAMTQVTLFVLNSLIPTTLRILRSTPGKHA